MSARFYYSTNGEDVRGPLSGDALKYMVDSGNLSKDIVVCEEGTENWRPYIQCFSVNTTKSIKAGRTYDLNSWQIIIWSIVIILGFTIVVFTLIKVLPGEAKNQQNSAPAPTVIARQPPAREQGFSDKTEDISRGRTETPKVIMGSTKTGVDALLKDWSIRKSNRATFSRPIYYYTKDVSVIIYFCDNKANGVSVIDRPGADVSSISQTRYDELVQLIGQQPNPNDVKRDSIGIREFRIGNTE